jgi:precorrin-6A/cobalt-precorrin-6A reductase
VKVLLLGGTGEARRLADVLAAKDITAVSSLAGRTAAAGDFVASGEVRVGGFGGVTGLVSYLRSNPVDAIIDATHPFAAQITVNATAAAHETGTPLLVLRRPGWSATPADTWHWTDTPAEAAALLPTLGSRVFLTTGRQGLDAFAHTNLWTLARCVDPPDPAPTWCTVLLARGPFALADELDVLRDHRIDVLVTKDSGGAATAAKLEAARHLGLPVVVIRRPDLPPDVRSVDSVDDVLTWLAGGPR